MGSPWPLTLNHRDQCEVMFFSETTEPWSLKDKYENRLLRNEVITLLRLI